MSEIVIGITDDYLNIDIKMETGTGKTFTQIKNNI